MLTAALAPRSLPNLQRTCQVAPTPSTPGGGVADPLGADSQVAGGLLPHIRRRAAPLLLLVSLQAWSDLS